MNRAEAIKRLVRAGKESDVIGLLERSAETAQPHYDSIRADRTLSDEGRRFKMAQVAVSVDHGVTQKLQQMALVAGIDDRADVDRIFGTAGIAGDPATLVVSRRDAADRMAQVTSASDLRELLARATRSGDEVLARAAAERAVDMRAASVLEQFIEDRPETADAVKRLWDASRAGDNGSLKITMAMVGLRPAELSGMSGAALEQLASADPITAAS